MISQVLAKLVGIIAETLPISPSLRVWSQLKTSSTTPVRLAGGETLAAALLNRQPSLGSITTNAWGAMQSAGTRNFA